MDIIIGRVAYYLNFMLTDVRLLSSCYCRASCSGLVTMVKTQGIHGLEHIYET